MKKMYMITVARIAAVFIFAISLSAAYMVPRVAHAATADSLYSYDFTGPVTSSTLPNGAAANTTTKLNLTGPWSKSDFGVHFMGDQVSNQSGAYTKPATGNTISVPASQAFGGAIKFKYEGPTDGKSCQGDSRNITQIGRFGEGLSQVKIQYSNCGTSATSVYPECRMAGASSTTNDGTVRSSQALLDGNTYIIKCVKAPDPASGTVSLNLKVVRVDAVNGNQVTDETFQIARTGLLQSTAYLSVANKFNLPPISENTDQFNGDVAKVAYCTGSSMAAAKTCLDTEVPQPEATDPTPPVDPTPTLREFVGNASFETDMTGWAGVYSATSQNTRVTGGYEGNYSLRSVNNSNAAGTTGFIDKNWWIDGTANKATVAGKIYTGSVWVKPDVAGQKLNLYLRERNAAGVTVNSTTTTIKAANTNWQKITAQYTASQTGNTLAVYVYLANADAHAGFNADLLSLTALN